ncbi:DNA repair protein REV1 [Mantella aurantiaca]
MRRGGWRNHASNSDGWSAWGGYMSAKVQKLDQQFHLDAPVRQQNEGASSNIFNGVSIYVNGYTDPTADQLRHLMMLHGGQYHVYYSRSKTTHIIASNLPNSKIKELRDEKVVRPEWITESIKAGRLLSYIPYQLYTKQSSVQKGLDFKINCRTENSHSGSRNVTREFNHKVNNSADKADQVNGVDTLEEEDEENFTERIEDFDLWGLEEKLSDRQVNGLQNHKSNTAVFNGHNCSFNGALKSLDVSVQSNNSFLSRLHSSQQQEKPSTGTIDCTLEQLQPNNGHTGVPCDPHRTALSSASSSYLHNNNKLNGAHHSLQGPSSTKSTTIHLPTKAASPQLPKTADSNFISDFYSHSRLHHISTWKCEFTEFVRDLQTQSNGIFPGRERLKKLKTGVCASSPPKCQKCIIHVDMDCFFVSVGIRHRPDLKGRPVAVTSNRGSGKVCSREGANPQLEMEYYQNNILKRKTDKEQSDQSNVESIQINGLDQGSARDNPISAQKDDMKLDISQLSLAEIASCSYEARQAGVRNGMMFGKAKQLCPDLQVVSYDFDAYKEVSMTLYKTLASYTHDIEAVSCDEALVDITEIIAETKFTPDEVASTIRAEIKEKTLCSASVGMGSNILLARMATRKAKPDGQYHLKPEEVDDFIRGQLVTTLPGVGRSMDYKLSSLSVKTCGDLQNLAMSKLQKEFGPKTGQMLYRFCRGLDDRPIRKEKERKSVSAEINYGIRFKQVSEAEAFLMNLSEEIQKRLESVKMKGRKLTLKIMVRKAGAPTEPAKYGGHGICDNIARTATLEQTTDNAKIIGKEVLKMFHSMKLNVSDMRGVGLQMHQLAPAHISNFVPLSHKSGLTLGGSRSLIGMFHEQRKNKPIEELSENKTVFVAALDVEISSAIGTCASIPHKTKNDSSQDPSTSKACFPVKKNGLHTPISVKSRVNFTIEVPSPSQIDPSVLEALPPDIREQVEQTFAAQHRPHPVQSKREASDGESTEQPVATVLLQIPQLSEHGEEASINVIALPDFSQVDPEVFAALPVDLQEELRAAYGQRNRQSESSVGTNPVFVSKNPLLQLKRPPMKSKKKSRKKNIGSPIKKMQSPLKNKLFGSPAKSFGNNVSPQKLKDGALKQEAILSGQSQVELGPSTSNARGSLTEGCNSHKAKAPNLAGAIEFNDVKTLLKEWITTISDPMEEDILQVVKYCTDLIEEKDLEKLDLVIKYMKRLMQQSVESVWNMAFDFILDNVQVVLQQTYGSTLKVV